MKNSLAFIWIAFLIGWKFAPRNYLKLTFSDAVLTIIMFASLAGVLFPAKKVPHWSAIISIILLFLFAIASRQELGETWERPIFRVETGPYALFSHPIYLSILSAATITGIATGAPLALPGIAMLAVLFGIAATKDAALLDAIEHARLEQN